MAVGGPRQEGVVKSAAWIGRELTRTRIRIRIRIRTRIGTT
jgi:hypothetical protein